MFPQTNSYPLQTFQINILNIIGGRLENDLKLVMLLDSIGIFAITSIGWSSTGLHIGNRIGLGTKDAKEGFRIHGTGPFLHIVGHLDHTALLCPKTQERKEKVLKVHEGLIHD